jgi:hypothetical protein
VEDNVQSLPCVFFDFSANKIKRSFPEKYTIKIAGMEKNFNYFFIEDNFYCLFFNKRVYCDFCDYFIVGKQTPLLFIGRVLQIFYKLM